MDTQITPPLDKVMTGYITYWNDEKGYGFIHYQTAAAGLFFHISAFPYHRHRPKKGEKIAFIATKQNKRYCAKRVVLLADIHKIHDSTILDSTEIPPHLGEAFIFSLTGLFFYVAMLYVSPPLAVTSLIISILTFILYSIDKRASLKHRQRIPEASLHIATMLGGWPGALIARALLRHKTKKIRFIIFFWLSIIINFAVLYAIVLLIPKHLEYFNNVVMSYLGF